MEYEQVLKEDWEVNVRTDMWNTMNVTQLGIQQGLILDKLNVLRQMPASPTVLQLQSALNFAMDDVEKLITNAQAPTRN
jgi:hypothetical protein